MKKSTKIVIALLLSGGLLAGAYFLSDALITSVKEEKPAPDMPADPVKPDAPLTHTVTFQYGELESTQTVATGGFPKSVAFASIPEGQKFAGWYIGETLIEDPWTYPITQDTVFTAKFETLTYQITIEVDGQQTTQTIEHGETITLESPTKEGYNFLAWSLDGQTVIDISIYSITQKTTFIAVFEEIEETLQTPSVSLFRFENGMLTGYSGTDTEIVIPSTYSLDQEGNVIEGDDFLVTSIGERAFYYSGITSIEIPNTVTSIGAEAFRYCENLTSITIPDNVETLGDYAFAACKGLIRIDIGAGVTTIGNNVFSGCSAVEVMIIRTATLPQVSNIVISNSNSKIYVPEELVSTYMTTSPWSKYDERYLSISELEEA